MQHDQRFPSARYFLSLIVDDFSTCSILFFFFSFFLYIPFSISVAGCRKLELKGCHVWDHTAARNSMWRISFESEKQSQLLFLSNRRILFLMVSNFKEGLEFWIFVVYKFETYGNSMFSSDIIYVQPRRRLMITLLDMVRLYGCNLENESRKCF